MGRLLENAMYAARWLLAPIYFGLSLALLALSLKFFQEIFHILPHVFELAEAELILVLLSLIDMALVGGLGIGHDQQGAHGGIALGLLHRGQQAGAHRLPQGIDGRVVDADHQHRAFAAGLDFRGLGGRAHAYVSGVS